MVKKITLELSDRASDKLEGLSRQLELSVDDFASLCFEYVDAGHQGIQAAARKLKQDRMRASINKRNLNEHLQELSSEQIDLLLVKAAQKRKN